MSAFQDPKPLRIALSSLQRLRCIKQFANMHAACPHAWPIPANNIPGSGRHWKSAVRSHRQARHGRSALRPCLAGPTQGSQLCLKKDVKYGPQADAHDSKRVCKSHETFSITRRPHSPVRSTCSARVSTPCAYTCTPSGVHKSMHIHPKDCKLALCAAMEALLHEIGKAKTHSEAMPFCWLQQSNQPAR